MNASHAVTEAAVRDLAVSLRRPDRSTPVVVVTTRSQDRTTAFDADRLAVELNGVADVWVIPPGRINHRFSDHMPEDGSVFGGAARVYPVGPEWLKRPYLSRLFTAYTDEEATENTEKIIVTVSRHAHGVRAVAPLRQTIGDSMVGLAEAFFANSPEPEPALNPIPVPQEPVIVESPAPQPPAEAPVPAPGPVKVSVQTQRPASTPTPARSLSAVAPMIAAAAAKRQAPEMVGSSGKTALKTALTALSIAKDDLEKLRTQHDTERRQADRKVADLTAKLAAQADKARTQAATARKKKVSTPAPERGLVDQDMFLDADEATRHAVYLMWVERVPAIQKAEFPLPAYLIGPSFTDSLDTLDDQHQVKALKCVVDILTGIGANSAARAVHVLRFNETGNSPATTRDDGATCFRANIESATASARRLHFWKLPDGSIELSRVVLHDDMKP